MENVLIFRWLFLTAFVAGGSVFLELVPRVCGKHFPKVSLNSIDFEYIFFGRVYDPDQAGPGVAIFSGYNEITIKGVTY